MTTLPKRAIRRARKELDLFLSARQAEAFLASYPKSGRTWLRFIIANYLNKTHDLGLALDLGNMFAVVPNFALDPRRGLGAWRVGGGRRGIPLILVSHEPYSRLRFRRRPVIFMVRDARDVMVSAYFHRTRHKRQFTGSMSAFIRDPVYGLNSYIRYLNGWAEGLRHHSYLVVSYEQLKADPCACAARCFDFLGWIVDRNALADAVAASSFDAMRSLELATPIPDHHYDSNDLDSLRVRRGEVGSYRTELSAEDVAWIQQECTTRLRSAAVQLLMRANSFLGTELGRV